MFRTTIKYLNLKHSHDIICKVCVYTLFSVLYNVLAKPTVFITSMETDVEVTVVEMSLLVLVLELALNNLKFHLMKL